MNVSSYGFRNDEESNFFEYETTRRPLLCVYGRNACDHRTFFSTLFSYSFHSTLKYLPSRKMLIRWDLDFVYVYYCIIYVYVIHIRRYVRDACARISDLIYIIVCLLSGKCFWSKAKKKKNGTENDITGEKISGIDYITSRNCVETRSKPRSLTLILCELLCECVSVCVCCVKVCILGTSLIFFRHPYTLHNLLFYSLRSWVW